MFWGFFWGNFFIYLFIFSLLLKSVFLAKSTISPLVAKFACFNLSVIFSGVNLLNSGVMIYLLWSGNLFLKAVRSALVAKLAILGILFLISFILALRALVAKLIISGILSSISLILALYTSF